MLEVINEFGREFVADYGVFGLFLLSFTDSFIQPIPPDPALATITAFGINPYYGVLVTIVASLLGALVGYFLGLKLGHPIAVKIFKEKNVNKAEKYLLKWEFWGVVFSAFVPVPYTIITWSAGIFEMPLGKFILASAIGRTTRFAIVAFGSHLLFV